MFFMVLAAVQALQSARSSHHLARGQSPRNGQHTAAAATASAAAAATCCKPTAATTTTSRRSSPSAAGGRGPPPQADRAAAALRQQQQREPAAQSPQRNPAAQQQQQQQQQVALGIPQRSAPPPATLDGADYDMEEEPHTLAIQAMQAGERARSLKEDRNHFTRAIELKVQIITTHLKPARAVALIQLAKNCARVLALGAPLLVRALNPGVEEEFTADVAAEVQLVRTCCEEQLRTLAALLAHAEWVARKTQRSGC
jgi:hypothetical protein